MDPALDGLILATAWLHTSLAPYTKVEESFNLHAIHDILAYGSRGNLTKYDHFVFPGAVPRTFLGSFFIAWIASHLLDAASSMGLLQDKFDVQILVRLILATVNAIGLCLIRRAVTKHFGRSMGVYYTILTCSQFHLPFWMGRTIPNMFALFFVNLSTFILLDRAPNSRQPTATRVSSAIAILTFTAAVFRGEVALYLVPFSFHALASKCISFTRLAKTGIISGVLSVALTISVDSYFWNQRLLWPEFSGIFFNVVQGKSSEWGVSPPLTYFTSFLPKLLLSSLPLALVSMAYNRQTRVSIFPSWVFLALISFLGHKEWRFIIYVVPLFNLAAARGLHVLLSPPKRSWRGRAGFTIATALVLLNISFTVFSTAISVANYPGGDAMRQFHALYNPTTHKSPVHVHISNLAAQTGASLFTQLHSQPTWPKDSNFSPDTNWIYNKTEGLTIADLTDSRSPFTHLILEEKPAARILEKGGWKIVDAVNGFEAIKIRPALIKDSVRQVLSNPSLSNAMDALNNVVSIDRTEKLWIAERL